MRFRTVVVSTRRPGRGAPLHALLIATVAAGLTLSACSSSSSSQPTTQSGGGSSSQGGVIQATIGLPVDLSGAAAFAGVEVKQAAEIAVDDVNKQGKVKLTLDIADTKSTPADAASVLTAMLPKVQAILGPVDSAEGPATIPILNASGKPTITESLSLTGRSDRIFTMSPDRAALDAGMVQQVAAMNIKTISILWDEDVPALEADRNAVVASAKEDGINVVDSIGADSTITDFSPQVATLLRYKPDAIGIFAEPNQSGALAAQLRGQGYTGSLFGQTGDSSGAFVKVAGAAAKGYLYSCAWDPSAAQGEGLTFLKAYEAAYPSSPQPTPYGSTAWDAIHIFADAFAKVGGTDPAKVANAIATGSFSGATQSTISFESNGFPDLHGLIVAYKSDGSRTLIRRLS